MAGKRKVQVTVSEQVYKRVEQDAEALGVTVASYLALAAAEKALNSERLQGAIHALPVELAKRVGGE